MRTQKHPANRPTKGPAGFTIVEVSIAMAGVVLILLACISSMTFSRVAALKAKEQAIALDFLVHYLENVRGLSFDAVRPGAAINPLLNGENGAPNIRIPASESPVSVDTSHFRAFHPELTWLAERDPQMTVSFSQTPVSSPRFKHLRVSLEWLPPLGRSSQRSAAWLDMVCIRDL